MLKVYACIAYDHDLSLVALAAAIALLGSSTSISLLRQVQKVGTEAGQRWLAAAILTAASTIWTTHFVAMLAFQPPVPVSYDLWRAGLSLLIAIVLTGCGFIVALSRPGVTIRAIGGSVLGLGIIAMHYVGMSGLILPGIITWDPVLVIASFIMALVLGSASLVLALGGSRAYRGVGAAGLLMSAICSLHFTAMGAASLELMPGVSSVYSNSNVSVTLIAISDASICGIILLLSLASLQLYRRNAKRLEQEQANLRQLADVSVEGLVVCKDGVVVAANTSFTQMIGLDKETVRGMEIDGLFDGQQGVSTNAAFIQRGGERTLLSALGERIPVEVVRKPIIYSGQPHQVFALRDLRERRKAEEEIRFLAHHDALTGLANRPSFGAGLGRQIREYASNPQPFAVFALDLDRFKDVNDSLGHHAGDLLLKRVAGRLQATIRDTDCIARLGGDEFAVLVPGPVTDEKIEALVGRVVEVLRRPYIIEGKIVNIGASIGVAVGPEDGTDAVALMKHADVALYRAKADGRNVARRYDPGMDVVLQTRRAMELELRRALMHGELEVQYQPLFNVQTQSVRGFEALVRWRHPERGLIPPNDFIPLAEETGLIFAVGEFVLEASTAQAMLWDENIGISVNLSAVQFTGGDLVKTVQTALTNSGLAPQRLELEITESVLLHDSAETLRTLHQLRDLGVRISMDDFGTGYSSLRYLRSFPFDRIKIDRSFIQEMLSCNESAAIISAVVALGQRLGITTTAEGVETEEQMARIQAEGCDTVQGFLVGRAVPADETSRYLTTRVEEAA